MPDEQTVYNICFRVSEIYKEAIEEQQYKTTKLHAPLNEAYHRYDSIGIGNTLQRMKSVRKWNMNGAKMNTRRKKTS